MTPVTRDGQQVGFILHHGAAWFAYRSDQIADQYTLVGTFASEHEATQALTK